MLSDRSYMRDDYPRQTTSALTWLISATIACFILQFVIARPFSAPGLLENLLGLSVANIKAGKVWTLVTYSLLHDTNNILHIIANLLGLYFLGRVLQPVLGSKRFLWLYASAVLGGGLFWLATHWYIGGGLAIGASAGVMGLFIVFACFYPEQPITFLLFFIVPVTLKPKIVAFALLAMELMGFFFFEIMNSASPFGSVAHSAHLGGMAVGWIYYRYLHNASWSWGSRRADIELPRWMKKRGAAAAATTVQVNVAPSRDDLRAEVDRILDKINSKGFGSLSADEKRLLDEAKDVLSRR